MTPQPPLAARMRPENLTAYGQQHLLAQGKPLRTAIESGKLYPLGSNVIHL